MLGEPTRGVGALEGAERVWGTSWLVLGKVAIRGVVFTLSAAQIDDIDSVINWLSRK